MSLVWGQDGNRMHYKKKASQWRQCDVLGNILLGNAESWHYLDTLNLNIVADQVHYIMATVQ